VQRTGRTAGGRDRISVTVQDEGVGIEPRLLPTVFDLFTQGEQGLDRKQGGLGIGLTLVKQLVELHDGSVEANSKGTGKGSEFTVHLPSATAPAPVPAAPAEPHRASAPRKLLIVDDNVDAAVSLRMLLELDGHEVEVAHDGDAGLKRLAEVKPEVALLDIGLPGMDGYELARRIRSNGDANVWLVAVSGYGQDHHQRSAQEAGFDRYLVKPVDFDSLSQLLTELPPRRESGDAR
jgi:CheY-like chemotaxis protein